MPRCKNFTVEALIEFHPRVGIHNTAIVEFLLIDCEPFQVGLIQLALDELRSTDFEGNTLAHLLLQDVFKDNSKEWNDPNLDSINIIGFTNNTI